MSRRNWFCISIIGLSLLGCGKEAGKLPENSGQDTSLVGAIGDGRAVLETDTRRDSTRYFTATEVDSPKTKKGLNPRNPQYPPIAKWSYRVYDSILVTQGAFLRLSPTDRGHFGEYDKRGKQPLPTCYPGTNKPLPFPYAYPKKYAKDIARLDSLKKVRGDTTKY